jgi:hypothetical protein
MYTQTKYVGYDVFASYCLKGQAHTICTVHTPPVPIAGSIPQDKEDSGNSALYETCLFKCARKHSECSTCKQIHCVMLKVSREWYLENKQVF